MHSGSILGGPLVVITCLHRLCLQKFCICFYMLVAKQKSAHKVFDGTFLILTHAQWPFSCDITGVTCSNHDVSWLAQQQTTSKRFQGFSSRPNRSQGWKAASCTKQRSIFVGEQRSKKATQRCAVVIKRIGCLKVKSNIISYTNMNYYKMPSKY